jgi:putative exporter of polyketide antibiotics
MYLTGICSSALTILPALFASKIASLSKDEGFTGFSLGLVGTLQNLGETFLGVAMGELLSYSLRTYSPNSWSFGLPYFVNSLFYLSVALVLCYAHYRYGVHRDIWVSQGVTFGTVGSTSPAPSNDETTTPAAAAADDGDAEAGAARTIAPTLKVVA